MAEKETSPWKLPYPTSAGEVKLGATDFEELAEKINTLFNEKFFVWKSYAGPATLKSGEWADQTKTAETFTMPAVGTANQYIATTSAVAEAKLTTAAKFVAGRFTTSTVVLTTPMAPLWQSD